MVVYPGGNTTTSPSVSSRSSPEAAAPDLQRRDVDRQLVVEDGRCVEVDVEVHQRRIAAGGHEIAVLPSAPPEELGHRDVAVLEVPRVEHDLLDVGLVVPDDVSQHELAASSGGAVAG